MKKIKRIYGGMLFEMLLMIVIVASIFPFIYKQNVSKNDMLENVALASELIKIKESVENYISVYDTSLMKDNQAYDINIETLYKYGLPESIKSVNKFKQPYYIKIKKTQDPSKNSYVYGVIYALPREKQTLKQSYDVLKFTGPSGGVLDNGVITGAGNAWSELPYSWGISPNFNGAIFVRITPNNENHLYIVRNGNEYERTMLTDLLFLNRDIKEIFSLSGRSLTTPKLTIGKAWTGQETLTSSIYAIDNLELKGEVESSATTTPNKINHAYIKNLFVEGKTYLKDGLSLGGVSLNANSLHNVSGMIIKQPLIKEGMVMYAEQASCVGSYYIGRTINENKLVTSDLFFYNKTVNFNNFEVSHFTYNSKYKISNSIKNDESLMGRKITKDEMIIADMTLLSLQRCLQKGESACKSDYPKLSSGIITNFRKIMTYCLASKTSLGVYHEYFKNKSLNYESYDYILGNNYDNDSTNNKDISLSEILQCLELQKNYNVYLSCLLEAKKETDPLNRDAKEMECNEKHF